MKKVILLMLAVFLVMGTIAAQEVKIGDGTLTFNGKITTGIEATFDDAANEDGKVRMYTDTDKTRLRAELTPTYVNGNVGFKTRFRADDSQAANAPVGMRFAYGWIDLLDSHFRPVGGFVDENVWGTLGDLDKDVNGAGLRLEFKPIAGLNFGAFLRVPSQNSTIEQFVESTALGLGYKHSSFYLRLQYLVDAIPGTTVSGTWTDDSNKNGQLDFGIGFTGLPALEAHAEGRIARADDFADTGIGDFRETVAYTISDALPLTIGLNAQEILYGNKNTGDPWLQLNPSISYALSGALSVGLGGGYAFGTQVDDITTPTTFTVYDSLVYVKPNLSYNFGKGLTTKLWYTFQNSQVKNAPDPVNASTIQLEFVYSF